MRTLHYRLQILWEVLTSKDLILVSFPKGMPTKENEFPVHINTATNNQQVDKLAESITGLFISI